MSFTVDETPATITIGPIETNSIINKAEAAAVAEKLLDRQGLIAVSGVTITRGLFRIHPLL